MLAARWIPSSSFGRPEMTAKPFKKKKGPLE
jgi:hypothetical protein